MDNTAVEQKPKSVPRQVKQRVVRLKANARIYSTEDFSKMLHYPLQRLLRNSSAAADQPTSDEADQSIPDEEVPLDKLFTQIINDGLVSLLGKLPRQAKVIVVGAGPAGLCTAYELKRAGMEVVLLEASQRVGGRVKTIFERFTPNLHGEGGAMRLPRGHLFVHTYLKKFGLTAQLETFEQENKIIYLSTYGKTITYSEFNDLLRKKDPGLLRCFPNLHDDEKGKTIDELWAEAVRPVNTEFGAIWQKQDDKVRAAYTRITELFDKYSLQTFFEQVAGWSQDCISLFDLGSPHVVLDNAFIESWKDGFLSLQSDGQKAGMQQMMRGMREIPMAFLNPTLSDTLRDDIRYGARAEQAKYSPSAGLGQKVEIIYRTEGNDRRSVFGDYVVFAIPLTAQRHVGITPQFSVAKTNAIRTVRYVDVTKILLQFKTRWWENYLDNLGQGKEGGVVTDLPIRYSVFPASTSEQFQNGEKRGVIMASYTFQRDATELGALNSDKMTLLAAKDLATIFDAKLVYDNLEGGTSQVWSADEFSSGSAFAYFAPMQKTRLFNAIIEPEWDGRAHFAGEHASYSHGWIEGAFESALRSVYQVYMAEASTLP